MKKNETAKTENLLTDIASLQKAEDDLKNIPTFQGKEIMVFQDVKFFKNGKITIELQDPEDLNNINHYEYLDGKWSDPQPVQITGDGEMKDNLSPISDVKFTTVATVYNNYMEKAKTVEGAENNSLTYVFYKLFVHNNTKAWITPTINGSREKYRITFNHDGSIKEYKKE